MQLVHNEEKAPISAPHVLHIKLVAIVAKARHTIASMLTTYVESLPRRPCYGLVVK